MLKDTDLEPILGGARERGARGQHTGPNGWDGGLKKRAGSTRVQSENTQRITKEE